MFITIGILIFSSLLYFFLPTETPILFSSLKVLLQGIQAILCIIIPLLASLLGRYWSRGRMTSSQEEIFLLWYNKKRKIFLIILYLLLGVSIFFAYFPRGNDIIAQFFSIMSWLFLGLCFDVLFSSLNSIEQHASPKNGFIIIDSEIKKSIQRRDMQAVLGYYELLFVALYDFLHTKGEDLFRSERIERDILNCITRTLDAMPKLALYQKNGTTNETLLDRITFLESLTSKKVVMLIQDLVHEYKKNGSMARSSFLFSLILKIFVLFHERYQSLGFILLQSAYHSLINDSKGYLEELATDHPILHCVITLSEGVKALIERVVLGKKEFISAIPRLLKIMESLMIELFRLKRSLNPALLMQPFAEIAEYIAHIQSEKLSNRDSILSQLKQILAQFAILETLSERLDIEVSKTDTEATYQEDLPFQSSLDKR